MAKIELPSDREVDQAIPGDEPRAPLEHKLARFVIPAAAALVGVVALILGATTIAIVAFLAALIAAVADRVIRLAIVSQGDRDREDAARREMRLRGRWPR